MIDLNTIRLSRYVPAETLLKPRPKPKPANSSFAAPESPKEALDTPSRLTLASWHLGILAVSRLGLQITGLRGTLWDDS